MTHTNHSPVLCAYAFDGQGGATPLEGHAIADTVKADQLGWVHLDVAHPDTKAWLNENCAYLDHLIIDALLADETRPRVIEYKDGMVVILRGVNLNDDAEPEDMISIRLWIDEHRIISTRRRRLKAITDLRTKLEEGVGPKNSADFVVALSSLLFHRMEPVIRDIDDRTDAIEQSIIDHPDMSIRHEIIDIRRMAIMMKRYIAPQRDVMSTLRTSSVPWFDDMHKRSIQENYDRVTRYTEDLDAIRERAQVVKDELTNILADRMNKNMYILSIIAAIFLPLGFITGLLGINVGGMPGADNDLAFWIVCLMCFGFGVSASLFFRFKKWV